ncbi:MAG: carboxypeptidase regulatory-like domain-containing protein [Spirochaetales bacterium]|nr:carboxypeptidase regulatory-like domain-containing protein [Spirochaetales bacterium]
MKKIIIIASLFILILWGCSLFGPDEKPESEYSISGHLEDIETEAVIEGASITIGQNQVRTDNAGYFKISYMNKQGNIRISKPGYVTYQKPLSDFVSNQIKDVNFALLPVETEVIIDPSVPNTVLSDSGASVTLPVLDDIEEDLRVSITSFDLSGDELEIVPGDFSAITTSNEEVTLISLGMIDVEITGTETGQSYSLSGNDQEYEITIPITSDLEDIPDEIPLWFFDKETGKWMEEGSAYRSGDRYTGMVRHFSTWNADIAKRNGKCITSEIVDEYSGSNEIYRISLQFPGYNRTKYQNGSDKRIEIIRLPMNQEMILGVTRQSDQQVRSVTFIIPEDTSNACYDIGDLVFGPLHSPTPTLTPIPTSTPDPTPTLTPSPTPTPTSTPTPTPTATPVTPSDDYVQFTINGTTYLWNYWLLGGFSHLSTSDYYYNIYEGDTDCSGSSCNRMHIRVRLNQEGNYTDADGLTGMSYYDEMGNAYYDSSTGCYVHITIDLWTSDLILGSFESRLKNISMDNYITITGSFVSYPYDSRLSKSINRSSLFEKEMMEERDRNNKEIIMLQPNK